MTTLDRLTTLITAYPTVHRGLADAVTQLH